MTTNSCFIYLRSENKFPLCQGGINKKNYTMFFYMFKIKTWEHLKNIIIPPSLRASLHIHQLQCHTNYICP